MKEKEKKSIIFGNKQCITYQKNNIKTYRSNNGRKYTSLTSLMDSTLISFEIDRERYHGGDLEGTSIINLFQNCNKSFHVFQTKIMTIITDDSVLTNLIIK